MKVHLLGEQQIPLGRVRAEDSRPVLCISDVHLSPSATPFSVDCPNSLCDLIEEFPSYEVLILGDLLESIPIANHPSSFLSSQRLRRFRDVIRNRSAPSSIVAGNHDLFAIEPLKRIFGPDRVHPRAFDRDGVVFAHGHERDRSQPRGSSQIARVGTRLGEVAASAGLEIRLAGAANAAISRHLLRNGKFAVFGHTHRPAIGTSFMNTGQYLRRRKTFGTIVNRVAQLWEVR